MAGTAAAASFTGRDCGHYACQEWFPGRCGTEWWDSASPRAGLFLWGTAGAEI